VDGGINSVIGHINDVGNDNETMGDDGVTLHLANA